MFSYSATHEPGRPQSGLQELIHYSSPLWTATMPTARPAAKELINQTSSVTTHNQQQCAGVTCNSNNSNQQPQPDHIHNIRLIRWQCCTRANAPPAHLRTLLLAVHRACSGCKAAFQGVSNSNTVESLHLGDNACSLKLTKHVALVVDDIKPQLTTQLLMHAETRCYY
jgi:hypothetical protein